MISLIKGILLTSLILSSVLTASEIRQEFSYANYDSALKAESNLQFSIKSTKFGLITSTIVGVARNFQIEGHFDSKDHPNVFSAIKVIIPISGLDTDNNLRDEKMQDDSFDFKKFPILVIEFPETIKETKEMQIYPAQITVRNKTFPVQVQLQLSSVENRYEVRIKGLLSFKQLEIPDPSIAIASVDDTIEVTGKINVLIK